MGACPLCRGNLAAVLAVWFYLVFVCLLLVAASCDPVLRELFSVSTAPVNSVNCLQISWRIASCLYLSIIGNSAKN